MDTLSTLRSSTGRTAGTSSALAQILDAASVDHADRCAIRSESEELTYRELHQRVSEVADRLRAAGIGEGSAVAVYLPRSVTAVIAIHAVIATGAVVAPLDVNDPPERTLSLVEQAAISHLLVPAERAGEVAAATATAAEVGEGLALTHRQDVVTPPEFRESGYLLFTSGSTGVPKGVLLSADAVSHFARWAAESLWLGPEDRIAAQAALTFDMSTFDIFATAVAGASAVIFPEWLKAFAADTVDWLAENDITAIYAVPTLLKGVVRAVDGGRKSLPALRAIAFAGEPYPAPGLAELLAAFAGVEVRNWYGPTETNVCTAADMRLWESERPVPIGAPIADVQTCIVDDDLEPAEVGELVVAGAPLLTGYVVDGTVVDPAVDVRFPDGEIRRAYRTGDLAHRDADGALILKGRADSQIKRRGYRIDLSGIEAIAIDADPVVGAAAVATGPDRAIVLFVETSEADAGAAITDEVGELLRARLPITSQPDLIVHRSPLPINRRGKVDRVLLEDLAAQSLTDQENGQ
ncbi:AMP-binding protein [Gordonia soli]|uniref:AMP-dependent synthetase/ligase domain-containing protein n=1 Tax=Gordonia soli NBRC 108243 TaxID=1223545 RepID=M0QS16_9ACTN|nr:AMP-binding protein [Gordonia soli]GAC70662.1 hypothetical protein GS4_38_00690 [Gordonia soli NBRC 108243]